MSRIAIISEVAPVGVGGLAAYQRSLAAELSTRHLASGSFICLSQGVSATKDIELAWPLKLLDRQRWNRMRPAMIRLASRPVFHSLLERLSRIALRSGNLARECEEVSALHFVGTGWNFLGFAVASAARRLGARFTVLPAVHPFNWGDDAIDIRLYSQADAVFCLSDSEKRHLAQCGVPEEKLVRCTLPPMCQNEGDGPRLRASRGIADRPSVLFIGRRDEGKGYPALLDAWALVAHQIPEAVLLLAGPGNPDVTRLAAIPANSVRDLGIPDESEKADALAACDVFCLPSAHESFGLVYIEAWSYGKPVICGPAPACRELVEEGRTGLWSSQQPKDLARAIVHLLEDKQERAKLGARGRQKVRESFTWDRCLNQHLQAFSTTKCKSI